MGLEFHWMALLLSFDKALLTNWSLGIASSKKESKKLEELKNRSLLIKKSFFERVVNKLKIILKGKK